VSFNWQLRIEIENRPAFAEATADKQSANIAASLKDLKSIAIKKSEYIKSN